MRKKNSCNFESMRAPGLGHLLKRSVPGACQLVPRVCISGSPLGTHQELQSRFFLPCFAHPKHCPKHAMHGLHEGFPWVLL